MEVKEEYKQTEVGIIPAEWEVKKLGLLVNNVEYGSAAKSKYTGAVPVLRMGNMQNGKFDYEDLVYTDDENEIRRYLLVNNDVLFNRTNTVDLVGKTAIYKGERPAVFAGYLIRINIRKDLLDADYLNYWLNTKSAKNYGYTVLSVAVSQANINGAKLKTYPIPLPPTKAEQTAIATVLSDTDALISRLETLIEKKRAIKQGAMQQLLKPKEGWEVKKLGDVTDIYTGKKNNQDKVENGAYPFFVRSQQIERINSYTFDGEAILIPGEGGIGTIFHYINGKFDFHQRVYKISDFKSEYSGKFIYCYMQEYFGKHAMSNSVKATVDSLRLPTLQEFEIPFPKTKEEQTRIAQILSDMDAEIAGLEQKLAKYKLVKQGMMQELLTGKTRLV